MNFIGLYILILLVNNTFEDRKQNIEEDLETANKTNIAYVQSGNDFDNQLPENEIFGAEISIIDDNKLTAVITCDTLISKNSNSAILKGNVVAKFYDSEIFNDTNANGLKDDDEWYDDENQNEKFDSSFIISQLKSNFAYSEKSSLIAKKNVSVVKFDNIDKTKVVDSLYFVDAQNSEITWQRKYGTIASDKSFILESGDGSCMSGNSFESDIELNNVKVLGVEGGNYCK
ncbi:MAG: hypothetical protein CMG11_02115 [Candidatus Marinimicrobia bacterium]|nr:hypothetical protein [Candidatus Neomarinimicrobiota bacterium]|tara:strand:+ start:2720 stop:3409 length:690 start_codon:yes stop_codon:yes gene_type:complete